MVASLRTGRLLMLSFVLFVDLLLSFSSLFFIFSALCCFLIKKKKNTISTKAVAMSVIATCCPAWQPLPWNSVTPRPSVVSDGRRMETDLVGQSVSRAEGGGGSTSTAVFTDMREKRWRSFISSDQQARIMANPIPPGGKGVFKTSGRWRCNEGAGS